MPNADDERKYQGQPHDLLVFDGRRTFSLPRCASCSAGCAPRCRAAVPGVDDVQPADERGRPVGDRFLRPWLDKKFPKPAKPGELLPAASLPASPQFPNGRDLWVDDGRPFVLDPAGDPLYDFDPAKIRT